MLGRVAVPTNFTARRIVPSADRQVTSPLKESSFYTCACAMPAHRGQSRGVVRACARTRALIAARTCARSLGSDKATCARNGPRARHE